MKKYIMFIGLGTMNLVHASMHVIQFIQSLLLIGASTKHHHEESLMEHVLHNPVLNIIWMLVAIFTFYLGVRDYSHHKRCRKH